MWERDTSYTCLILHFTEIASMSKKVVSRNVIAAMFVDENKDLSLASFVRPPAIVYYIIVICVFRDWLQTIY